MKFVLNTPSFSSNEVQWIAHVLLTDFLGLNYQIKHNDEKNFRLEFAGKTLQFPDCFLGPSRKNWLQATTLPSQPLSLWENPSTYLKVSLVKKQLPILFGNPGVTISENHIYLNIDIFGSSFFMLSRYEEAVKIEKDEHERFPATASLAYQEGFLDRPIVNEYVEILWACMKRLWPDLERKKRQFSIIPTHDVDLPYCIAGRSLSKTTKFIAAEALKRKRYKTALKYLSKIPQIKAGHIEDDPFNTFDWLMKKSEMNNLKSTFFFFTNKSGEFVHGDYLLEEPLIKSLIHKIHNKGHEIGLHGSLNSFIDQDLADKEANALRRFCEKEKIIQEQIGIRQHFLRWRTPETFAIWEKAGLTYDSTLGFADMPGFRCGTCYDFPAYDLKEKKQLKIREKPLIAMESSILDSRYMGMDNSKKSYDIFVKLIDNCKLFNGQFVLLWHNSYLVDQAEKELYESILSC